MKKIQLILIFVFWFVQTVYSQCDRTPREKVIFASLNYFQDSINGSQTNANILIIDTTQYSEYPNLSFEPNLFSVLPDTSILADLLSGFKKTLKDRKELTTFKSCSRITLTTHRKISQILSDTAGWRNFNTINPNEKGYYTTTEPFVSGNFAVIYLENFCGNLCGSGYLLYLKYREDLKEWRIIYSKQTWVS
jgi:hypothetical protein